MPRKNDRKHVGDGKHSQKLVTVGTTIRVPQQTFELLQDVALFRHLRGVAEKSKKQSVKSQTKPTISDVITDLVEKHRAALESELDTKFKRKV